MLRKNEVRKNKNLRIVVNIGASKIGMGSEKKYLFNEYEEPPATEDSPEIKLLTALLARAITDLGPSVCKKERRDALFWFKSTEPHKYPITFDQIIDALQLGTKMLKCIEVAIKEAEILEDITREIENAQENQQLPEGKTSGAHVSKLVKRAWRKKCEANGAVFREKRWPFGRSGYRRTA